MVRNFVQDILQTERLHHSGILTWSSRHNAERRLAKRLKQDIQKEMSGNDLRKLQAERSKKIYAIRSRLEKSLKEKSSLKSIDKLEKKSIQKMRKYESELRAQVKKISKTITDSHQLIIYEQQQTTHDVATVITFLTHFIQLVELYFSEGDLLRYVPQHFQLHLHVLVNEASSELAKIEKEAEETISSEFNLHSSLINRSKSKVSTPKDLSFLIQERTAANKRLYGRISHLTHILKDLEKTLVLVAKHAKLEPHGVFLPELSVQSTHLSVNLTLLQDSIHSAIMGWPINNETRQTIRKEASQVFSQLYDLKLAFKSRIKEREAESKTQAGKTGNQKILKHWSKLHFVVEAKKQEITLNDSSKIINKISQMMQIMNPSSEQQEECLTLLKKYLKTNHSMLNKTIIEISTKTIKEGVSKTQLTHKLMLLKKFTKAIKTFQSKMFYFYKQIHQRLQNTTDIIVSSLTIQQQLALTLTELQDHLNILYKTLIKEHRIVALQEESQYKTKVHQSFVKEIRSKEELMKQEIKELQETVGTRVQNLITEIPKDQVEESNVAAANISELRRLGTGLARSIQHVAAVLGASAAK